MEAACAIQVASRFSSSLSVARTSRERTSLYWPRGGTGSSKVPLKKLNLTWCWKAQGEEPALPLHAVKRAAPPHGLADAGTCFTTSASTRLAMAACHGSMLAM